MRKRQCANCNAGGLYGISATEYSEDSGRVINVRNTTGKLPGLGDEEFSIHVYTVECIRCKGTWRYRKKI